MVVASLGALLLALATPLPAAAHESLVSSDPASGARLAAAPETVTLEFSADVLEIGAAIVVLDGGGADWVRDEPQIAGSTVRATLESGLPDGGYEIRWQVVSADGHPISGRVPFTVGDGAPLEAPGADERSPAVGTAEPVPPGAGSPDPLRLVLVGAGGAGIALAIFALIRFLLRRRLRGGTPDPR